MTMQEAIRSGKKFRRPKFLVWWSYDKKTYSFYVPRCSYYIALNFDQIVATDWEVLLCKKHDYTTADAREAHCPCCTKDKLAYPPKPRNYATLIKQIGAEFAATTHTCKDCGNTENCECQDTEITETLPKLETLDPASPGTIKCQCGADTCKLGGHSPWCPKFNNK